MTTRRPYRMRARAELMDQTRQRITEAAVRLHTTIGPGATSIAAIAEEAGVTRVTVYRHFPDIDALFEACQAHWTAQNPSPDAAAWPSVPDLGARVQRGLTELYGWYREHADELFPIHRDMTLMPMSTQVAMRATNDWVGDRLVEGFAGEDDAGRRLRVAARHLVDYPTWRSLAVEHGLPDADAVRLGVAMLTALAVGSRAAADRSTTAEAR